MKIILTLILLLLIGCTEPLTNDEIIKEVEKCENAGLEAQFLGNGLSADINKVQCIKIKECSSEKGE